MKRTLRLRGTIAAEDKAHRERARGTTRKSSLELHRAHSLVQRTAAMESTLLLGLLVSEPLALDAGQNRVGSSTPVVSLETVVAQALVLVQERYLSGIHTLKWLVEPSALRSRRSNNGQIPHVHQ